MEKMTDSTNEEVAAVSEDAVSAKKKNVKIDPVTGQVVRGFWQEELHRLKKHRSIIWFVLPALSLVILFGYVPMVGMLIAFRSKFKVYMGGGIAGAWASGTWSLENFALIATDPRIGLALKNTLLINFFGLLITFPLPIICALLLADIKSAAMSKFVLIVLCLPNFLSWTMTVGIWANVMSPTDGMLNNFLCDIGILKEPFDFFGSNPWFKPLVIFLKVWKGTGWSSIIFYAAIASIDKSFFEAATLDGASKFQKILWITLPTIVPVIGLQLIMTVTYIMSVGLEQLMAMYTAETKHEQFTVDTYLYEISIQDKTNAPLATVLGIVNGLIALFLMLGGNAISKKLLRTSLW